MCGGLLGARMRRLRKERGLTLDDLAFAAREFGARLGPGWIGQLERDTEHKKYPSVKTLGAVARALDVPPTVFPEYRLGIVRELLDEREVGLEAALRTLAALSLNAEDAPPDAMRRFAEAMEGLAQEPPEEHPEPAPDEDDPDSPQEGD